MAQDAGSTEGVKTGEEELLDFEFEELDEEGFSDSLEELTSDDIIELVEVVEEGEPLQPAKEEAPAIESAAVAPEAEEILELRPEDEEGGGVVEVQPEAVSDAAAGQSIEMEIDAALKGLEIPEEESLEVTGEAAPDEEVVLDFDDLQPVEQEKVPEIELEAPLEAPPEEQELPVEEAEELPIEAMEVLEEAGPEPKVPEAEPDVGLEGISEEQLARMAEGMDLEARIDEGPLEVGGLEEVEALSEELPPEREEVPMAEAGEVPGAMPLHAELGKTAEPGALVHEAAPEAAPVPAPLGPVISEELEETITRIIRETVERVSRETMVEVAERVITEAIEALKKSMESTPE